MQKFKIYLPNKTFILNETVRKIKSNVKGGVKTYNLVNLCKSIKIYNKDIIIDIFPVKTEYKNKNKEIETKKQNIIIIYHKEMIQFLSQEKATQFGINCTFRIITKSLKPYKMMTIYAISPNKDYTILCCLICLKYTDSQSLIKLFS